MVSEREFNKKLLCLAVSKEITFVGPEITYVLSGDLMKIGSVLTAVMLFEI